MAGVKHVVLMISVAALVWGCGGKKEEAQPPTSKQNPAKVATKFANKGRVSRETASAVLLEANLTDQNPSPTHTENRGRGSWWPGGNRRGGTTTGSRDG